MFFQPFVFGVLFMASSASLIIGKQPDLLGLYVSFTFAFVGAALSIYATVNSFKRKSLTDPVNSANQRNTVYYMR